MLLKDNTMLCQNKHPNKIKVDKMIESYLYNLQPRCTGLLQATTRLGHHARQLGYAHGTNIYSVFLRSYNSFFIFSFESSFCVVYWLHCVLQYKRYNKKSNQIWLVVWMDTSLSKKCQEDFFVYFISTEYYIQLLIS